MRLYKFIFFLLCINGFEIKGQVIPVNYLAAAEDMLKAIKNKEETTHYKTLFANAKEDILAKQLGTDEQKIAFWVNIYNAYIQDILTASPQKYGDRQSFFKYKQINMAGKWLSFSEIEHGIIRGSQHEYFMGYFKKPFVGKFEKKFRVQHRDYRIHFALNCGAKSCPPIAIYDWMRLSTQLDMSAKTYLKRFTIFSHEQNTALVTSLFSWFRGDFGGLDGIKDILLKLHLIPDKSVRIKTLSYDWTLDLGNFIDL